MMAWDQSGSGGAGEELSDSGIFLSIEPRVFLDRERETAQMTPIFRSSLRLPSTETGKLHIT